MQLTCSIEECGRDILGTGVVVITDEEDATERRKMTLHPKCFTDTFEELQKQELMTTFWVALGPVGDIKAALFD